MNAPQNCEELTWSEWTYGYRCQHSKKINSINELFQIMTYMMELFDGLLKCSASTMPADVKTIACDGVLSQDEIVDIFERNIIESILFCYFLKFGNFYLSDALVVIMRILLQHRYVSQRAIKSSIVQYASDSELVLIIDRATSPTFFLAEARNIAKELSYPTRQNMSPIMRAMRLKASNIAKRLESKIIVESFKNLNR